MKASGTSPAERIADIAELRIWPTTSGTTIVPRETLITTVDPLATLAPAAGLWLRTVPRGLFEATLEVSTTKPRARSSAVAAAAGFPTTLGTARTPAAETERVTTDLRATREPTPGSSAKTLPAGMSLVFVTTRATSPLRLTWATAFDCGCPSTLGTTTEEALFLPSPRVSNQTATTLPMTRSRRARSHGHNSGPRGGGGGGSTTSSSTTVPGGTSWTIVSASRLRNRGDIDNGCAQARKPRTSGSRNPSNSPTES